jgi:hypothetical protein
LLTEFELGDEALRYIRSQLASGRALGRALSELPEARGRVTTFLPQNVGTEQLIDFDSGGVANGEENQRLTEFTSKYLGAQPARICVLEHAYARLGDPKLPDVPLFTVGEDVFMFADQETPVEVVLKIAREGHLYPSIGALATLPVDQALPLEGSEQTPTFLRQLAQAADYTLIGAYDGEAWLIWSLDNELD